MLHYIQMIVLGHMMSCCSVLLISPTEVLLLVRTCGHDELVLSAISDVLMANI